MINSRYNEKLDSSIREVLKNTSPPYSPGNWEEMERLLEKDHRKYGNPFGDYLQYFIVGGLGMVLIGGLVFMIFRNGSPGEDSINQANPAPSADTSKITNKIVQDTAKKENPPAAIATIVDTTAKKALTPEEEEQNKTEEILVPSKKKKTIKDTLGLSSSPTQGSVLDSNDIKKSTKKKKKKKSSSSKDSLLKADPSQGINFLESVPKPLPSEEPAKSSRDSSK